jgi:2-oxoglutarate ferredoxin oxidoreductase subunit alpha
MTTQVSGQNVESAVIRFAGDSGDGIQLTGTQFTNESALAGNDVSTFPDFPAEIRAPAGTVAGVSGYQINFGSFEIFTPGDTPDVLVAMNPAALKKNLADIKPGGTLILNEDSFTAKNLSKCGYETNPCEDESLKEKYRVYPVPITKLTKEAVAETGISSREAERCKNFFTLGIMLWMYNRPTDATLSFIEKKFAKLPEIAKANTLSLQAGITYAEATEMFEASYVVKAATLPPGTYKNIRGVTALGYGLVAASQKSDIPLFLGAYPITPASDLLHELARHKHLGVTTFQAEDEIAAVCAAIGASYAGKLAITSSSGPGIALKGEALGLAVITELPLVVINLQRGGPSTGLPTKTEQSDLMQALYGRSGEAPMCVLATSTPSSCFDIAFEACRIAIKYMTPVMLLTDGYTANCSEPWRIPEAETLKTFSANYATTTNNPEGKFLPYKRDASTLARPWALPGTPKLMHRIGGLEKEDETGNVSYDPENHQLMTDIREAKIQKIINEIPPTEIDGPDTGDVLVVGWGGTAGTLTQATKQAREEAGVSVSRIHIHYINPLPSDLADIFSRFKRILIAEINSGQLRQVIAAKYPVDPIGLNIVRGRPIPVSTVVEKIIEVSKTH